MTTREKKRLSDVLRIVSDLYVSMRGRLTARADMMFRAVILELMEMLKVRKLPPWW